MTISRRSLLKAGTTAATVAALPSILTAANKTDQSGTGFTVVRMSDKIVLKARNGIAIEFALQGHRLRGIRSVTHDGKPLRNPSEFIWPEIATPYGVAVDYLEMLDVRHEGDAVIVSTRPYYRTIHRMEWTEHALHPLINTNSWSKDASSPEGSRLDWILREVNERLDDVDYAGFSYGFHYAGPEHPIYQIEDKATWELGGDIVNNGFIMRGGGTPHTHFAQETSFYSGWDYPGLANPHVFQHKPLYTQMQGFTFQYDAAQVLVTVHEQPSHVRALFQRRGGQPMLLHFNQFCFDLTTEKTTPARKILVGRRKNQSAADLTNHYLRVRDVIQDRHRKYYRLRYDKTRPGASVETWNIASLASFEPAFAQLKKWGINRTFIMPLWRSTETDINPRFKDDKDRFGIFGNMCCPLELEIADCYGGWEGFRKLMQQAAALKLETYMWYATHFSSMTPLLRQFPDLFCREMSGQFNHNNYGHVLLAINQRSPQYQNYLMKQMRKAKDCGLTGVFHDSHFNLATDTINFLHVDYFKEDDALKPRAGVFYSVSEDQPDDRILSMHDTSLELQRRLQSEIGLIYYVESQGALGTSMAGLSYADIRGNEFIYSNMEAGLEDKDLKEFGDDPTVAYFRALSSRLMFQVAIDLDHFPEPRSLPGWWNPAAMAPLNQAFARVEEYMDEMWVLEDGQGMLWKGPQANVLFAYKDFEFPLPGNTEVLDAISATSRQATGALVAKKMGIYLLTAI